MDKKRIYKLVEKMVEKSFKETGELSEKDVKKYVDLITSLPKQKAIVILERYFKQLKIEVMKRTVQIESGQQLNKSEIATIYTAAKQKYSVSGVTTKINSSLLGGIRVTIGDVVFDNTLDHKIQQVKEVISG